MNTWKLLAMTVTFVLLLILSLIFVFGPSEKRIELSDYEKERAIAVATNALVESLPGNYTVTDPVVGLHITSHSKAGGADRRIAFVTFRSDNFSAGVVVDLDTWGAVRLTENFDWMAEAPSSRGWYHESWTWRLNRAQKISTIGVLLGGACLLYWGMRRKRGEKV